jgi:SAM-dependent methyltransferase
MPEPTPIGPQIEIPRGVKIIDCKIRTMLSRHEMRGPWCHVGSLLNKADLSPEVLEVKVKNWRRMFRDLDDQLFVGLDIFPGPNVDIVADLCDPDFEANHPELIGAFGTVLCRAVLEHVKQPHIAAENINRMIRPGGHLYFAGPWIWGYHGYPGHYFNISFDGIKLLFPDLEWKQHWYESTIPDVGLEVDDYAKREKSLFRLRNVDGVSSLIADIGLPYLNLSVVARKPGG